MNPQVHITYIILSNELSKTQYEFLYLQFRGAFKRFVKSQREKDMEQRWTRINRQSFKIGFKSVNEVEGADSDDEHHDNQRTVSKKVKLAKRRYISKVILRSRSDEGISFEDYENQMNGSNRFDMDNFRSIPHNLHLCELTNFISLTKF